ncbi:bifunctional 4-hydroxy-2-oxoglutarate aldolase/2-dehydro-3-deoxy-phosphogluconate aldolase [Nocardioides sp. TRM66260-LWL]|uniref:bifunctional 4-hydroxy-2-oxoglutarate aldolase/2-dehydro-3-deoxy-phosphogluconate aldolase n=1 Tax=Nocardioides sp. TRM66260-LWL TaxID=2874478 RepID=UPI001CC66679|nr:bifunctional 4-hydroxy-2-oxoglutarate aldolase/2-dehydro-3-deoxy-phosphogluconate aldolase [Nocardioides sp. TRM66260-LWL]MBZ5736059.1 bifunctional 4-hydroxy-2-oxoglutarate aldolase/2-dehydro-3-deoxy-phosphogluconate aldolase [Nocardioides sp. TRM66260-LWL]
MSVLADQQAGAAAPGSVLDLVPVVPVVVVDDVAAAVPLARALAAGGVPVVELTLRTPAALDAIRAIATEVPEVVIGAGTVTTPGQADAALAAGARFLVSPGATAGLLAHLAALAVPCLPGTATVSEVLAAREAGFTEVKHFPAEASGGTAYLKAVGSVLPDVRFCPTGGIVASTAGEYLALPHVACVGGSWLTPKDAVAAADWARITALAAATVALRP